MVESIEELEELERNVRRELEAVQEDVDALRVRLAMVDRRTP